jgi:hypothetical protein
MSSDAPRSAAPHPAVAPIDRMVDAAALVLLGGGVAAFFTARYMLGAIGAERLEVPWWLSAVAVTERYDALSRFALWLIAGGALVGVTAAARHAIARSRAVSAADTSPSSAASPVAAD